MDNNLQQKKTLAQYLCASITHKIHVPSTLENICHNKHQTCKTHPNIFLLCFKNEVSKYTYVFELIFFFFSKRLYSKTTTPSVRMMNAIKSLLKKKIKKISTLTTNYSTNIFILHDEKKYKNLKYTDIKFKIEELTDLYQQLTYMKPKTHSSWVQVFQICTSRNTSLY